MTWKWITYENGMAHACPVELEEAVMGDMFAADPPAVHKETKVITSVSIDQPGMCAVNRPWEEFAVCGLRVDIPSEDVADFIEKLVSAEPINAFDQTFYRMCGHYWRCVVLTDDARTRLLADMRARLVLAEQRAQEFYADKATPQEALRAYNESKGAIGLPYAEDTDDERQIHRLTPTE